MQRRTVFGAGAMMETLCESYIRSARERRRPPALLMDNFTWKDMLDQVATAGLLGLLGRVVAIARNNRPPLGWSTLWEIPVALCMGLIGEGLCQYMGWTGREQVAVIVIAGYIGPRGLDSILLSILERWVERQKNND